MYATWRSGCRLQYGALPGGRRTPGRAAAARVLPQGRAAPRRPPGGGEPALRQLSPCSCAPSSTRRCRSPRTRAWRNCSPSPPRRSATPPTATRCWPRSGQRPASTIRVLPGPEEARLTFLAARRWFGWSSGRVLMLDIGGGSLEIAAGLDEEPDVAVSLPLGAGRLTRDWLTGDPPAPEEVRQLRKHVRAEIAPAGRGCGHGPGRPTVRWPPPRRSGSSPGSPAPPRRQRGRTCGGRHPRRRDRPGRTAGRRCPPTAGRTARCVRWCGRRSSPPARWWPTRRWTCSGLTELEICPWALREGVILRRIDTLAA